MEENISGNSSKTKATSTASASRRPAPLVARRRVATGLGLVAVRPIKRSQRIVEYTGQIISAEAADLKGGRYLIGLDARWVIDGTTRTNHGRYVNHSCAPNAEALITGRRIWICARRAIAPGDEITMDYGPEYFEEFIKPAGCKCVKCTKQG